MVINFKGKSSNVVVKNKEKGESKMTKSRKIVAGKKSNLKGEEKMGKSVNKSKRKGVSSMLKLIDDINLRGEEIIKNNIERQAIVCSTISTNNRYLEYEKQVSMINYATKCNLNIVKVFTILDTAWNQSKRRTFSQMLNFVKENPKIKHIIIDSLNTTNCIDKSEIKDLIDNYGITFHVRNINKIYNKKSPIYDNFIGDLDAAIAKKISDTISKKTILAMERKAEEGIYPGRPPVGYINDKTTKTIGIDNKTAPKIRFLFEEVAKKKILTIRDFAEIAIQSNLKPMQLFFIIANPFYCGFFKWRGKVYDGKHIPLVSKENFFKINKNLQKLFKENNKSK